VQATRKGRRRPHRSATRSWIAALLVPAVIVAARAWTRPGVVEEEASATTPRRTVPLTGTIAAIADCGRDLVRLRDVRTRWVPASRETPGPLVCVVLGTANDRPSLDRFVRRLRSHGFLGRVDVGPTTSPVVVGGAVDFEIRLGATDASESRLPSPRAIVASAESIR